MFVLLLLSVLLLLLDYSIIFSFSRSTIPLPTVLPRVIEQSGTPWCLPNTARPLDNIILKYIIKKVKALLRNRFLKLVGGAITGSELLL